MSCPTVGSNDNVLKKNIYETLGSKTVVLTQVVHQGLPGGAFFLQKVYIKGSQTGVYTVTKSLPYCEEDLFFWSSIEFGNKIS